MADKTGIEWTDATWNPTTGCDRVSAGCDNCYALTLAGRLQVMGSPKYQTAGDPRTSGPGFGIAMHPDTLDQALRWTRPRRIFVNSMSDLFHQGVTDAFIAETFSIIARAPQHTFQVLTKRHGRMRSLLNRPSFQDNLAHLAPWPLPNLWLGVSVEDQANAALRIPALQDTPAAVRWISAEPLLGAVDLTPWLPRPFERQQGGYWVYPKGCDVHGHGKRFQRGLSIGWVVAGGESGPGARPMHPDWARSLRDQCAGASVPFLFKQWGEWAPHNVARPTYSQLLTHGAHWDGTDAATARVGKRVAGRVLDGRTHDDYPAARSAGAVTHG